MEEGLKTRHLKIYCPQHQAIFEVAESPKIVCEIREHALSNNFPNEEFWEYCCDCQTFSPSQLAVGGKAKTACPQCERPTVSRFVCDVCNVIAFDSGEDTKGKLFHLDSENFAVAPSCPGCLTNVAETKSHLHKCAEIEAVLSTPRETCPFCKKETVKKPPKPKAEAPQAVKCPKCRTNNEANSFFCNNCGEELRSSSQLVERGTLTAKTQLLGSICPNCGASNQVGSTFCAGCGQALKVEKNKPKQDKNLPPAPPIPQSSIPTQVLGTSGASGVKPPAVKPGNGKGCLIAVGVLIGAIFLCVVIQGVISNKKLSSSSYPTPSSTSSSSTPGYSPSPNSSSTTSLPNSFEKDYQGTIGGKSFSMSLKRSGSELRGTASTSKSDTVEGTIDSDGSFSLKGYENGNKMTGNYNGRIYSDGSISGTWTNLQGGQGTSFSLSEQ